VSENTNLFHEFSIKKIHGQSKFFNFDYGILRTYFIEYFTLNLIRKFLFAPFLKLIEHETRFLCGKEHEFFPSGKSDL